MICAVCGRALELACFPSTPWSWSWSPSHGSWCAECQDAVNQIRAKGFGGALSEVKALARAEVLQPQRRAA